MLQNPQLCIRNFKKNIKPNRLLKINQLTLQQQTHKVEIGAMKLRLQTRVAYREMLGKILRSPISLWENLFIIS